MLIHERHPEPRPERSHESRLERLRHHEGGRGFPSSESRERLERHLRFGLWQVNSFDGNGII